MKEIAFEDLIGPVDPFKDIKSDMAQRSFKSNTFKYSLMVESLSFSWISYSFVFSFICFFSMFDSDLYLLTSA